MSEFLTTGIKAITSAKVILGNEAKIFNAKKMAQAEKYIRKLTTTSPNYGIQENPSLHRFDIIKYVKGKIQTIGSVGLNQKGKITFINMLMNPFGARFYVDADKYISKTAGKNGNHIVISRVSPDVIKYSRGITSDLHQINIFG